MSLINDALQRAKQAQQTVPPSNPNLEFRPAEPQPARARTFGPVWFVVLGAALLGGIASIVIRSNEDPASSNPTIVKASTAPAAEQTAAPIAPAEPTAAELEPELLAASPVDVNTNLVEVPEPTVTYRLQGILFNPNRPSAIVNGTTVFVGSQVGEQRVAAISPETVTLVGLNQTNVLSLASGQ